MANLTEIYDYYREEALSQTISARLLTDVKPEKEYPIFYFDRDKTEISFIYNNENNFRVDIGPLVGFNESKSATASREPFNNLYWIQDVDDQGNVQIGRLPCKGEAFPASEQCICFGQEYVKKYMTVGRSSDKERSKLEKMFVFSDGFYSYIFFRSYAPREGQPEQIRLYGSGCEAFVEIKDGYWEIKTVVFPKQGKKFGLPRRFDKFSELHVHRYKNVNIEERTHTSIALDTLRKQDKEGHTLISLWTKYFNMEIEEKRQLAADIEDVRFKYDYSKRGGTTVIKLEPNEFAKGKWELIRQHRHDLEGQMLIFSKDSLELENSMGDDDEEDASSENDLKKKCSFKIKKIDSRHKSIEINDESYIIRHNGSFSFSTIGDEVANSRRINARDYITNISNGLMGALYFAIEGKVDDIAIYKDDEIWHKPVTPKTEEFLKEIGIEKLTADQEKAVEYALNTPDIALIQGPPGTGKSTVVSVICQRLEEIALERKDFDPTKKIFLVSAFQHDTVENTASKIKTNGLPTPKVGEQDESLSAEKKYIDSIRKHLDERIENLKIDQKLKASCIDEIIDLIDKKSSSEKICSEIEAFLKDNSIPEERHQEWLDLRPKASPKSELPQVLVDAFLLLPEDIKSFCSCHRDYLDPMWDYSDKLTLDESDFIDELNDKPAKKITEDDFKKLLEIKNKYCGDGNPTENGIDTVKVRAWLNELRNYFIKEETNPYGDDNMFYYAVLSEIKKNLEGNDKHIKESLMGYSKSIAATNSGAGRYEVAQVGLVENVILEEAARSNPLDLLIPMTRAERRIIMVGDQMQLPHLLDHRLADKAVSWIDDEAKRQEFRDKFDNSLFGHIYNNLKGGYNNHKGDFVNRTCRLTKQFRMHPVIGNFISELYYDTDKEDERLVSGLGDELQSEKKKHGLSIPEFKDRVCVFVDVPKSEGGEFPQPKDEEKKHAGKGSKWRPAECKRIFSILDAIREDPIGKDLSIGVITFYARQRDELFWEGEERKGRKYIRKGVILGNEGGEKLRIGTVDSFQGKEFDVVILSTVRSNDKSFKGPKENYGFLTLDNRLNVAFSRAQKLLITVGDAEMFQDKDAEDNVKGLYEFYKRFHI